MFMKLIYWPLVVVSVSFLIDSFESIGNLMPPPLGIMYLFPEELDG